MFEPLAIAMQKTVAVSLLIYVPDSFAGTIPSFRFLVKVRAFRIVSLPAPAIVRTGEHAIVVADVVSALAVIVIRIIALCVNDRVVVGRRTIATVSVSMVPSVMISMAVAVWAAIAISFAAAMAAAGIRSSGISTSTRSSTNAIAVARIAASAISGRIFSRGSASSDATRNYYFAVLCLGDPITSIATAIAFHRAAYPGIDAVIPRRPVIIRAPRRSIVPPTPSIFIVAVAAGVVVAIATTAVAVSISRTAVIVPAAVVVGTATTSAWR